MSRFVRRRTVFLSGIVFQQHPSACHISLRSLYRFKNSMGHPGLRERKRRAPPSKCLHLESYSLPHLRFPPLPLHHRHPQTTMCLFHQRHRRYPLNFRKSARPQLQYQLSPRLSCQILSAVPILRLPSLTLKPSNRVSALLWVISSPRLRVPTSRGGRHTTCLSASNRASTSDLARTTHAMCSHRLSRQCTT